MAWSKYQNDIFKYVTAPDSQSFVISAVAGSGKTTTLVECAKRLAATYPDKSILFLAFNKSIVDKLKEETIGLNMRCATLHSFGFSTLLKSKMKFNMNEYKWSTYIKTNMSKLLSGVKLPEKKEWLYQRNCLQLLNMCRINLIKAGVTEAVANIADKYGISTVANEVEAVSKMLKKVNDLFGFKNKKTGAIDVDYIDMLCLPQSDGFRKFISKYDTVFIDEAQDLNLAQQELMLLSVKKDGRFVGAGDPHQSINAFAGSLTNSFDRLLNKADKKQLPLSVNYRCGNNIINEAQKLVPVIQAYEDAIDGEVVHQEHLKNLKAGDMIICRKTAPLILVTLKLMSKGISAFIKGKDLAEGMKNLIIQVTADGSDNGIGLSHLFSKLEKHIDNTRDELISQGVKNPDHHPKLAAIYEKVASIKMLGSQCDSVGEIYELLDRIFLDSIKGDAIILSTIHKAKGLEADNVFIICPEILPMVFEGQQGWELQQEMNLKYVAVTRAKKKLTWVDVGERQIEDVAVD